MSSNFDSIHLKLQTYAYFALLFHSMLSEYENSKNKLLLRHHFGTPFSLDVIIVGAPKRSRTSNVAGDIWKYLKKLSWSPRCVAFRGSPERDKKSCTASMDSKDRLSSSTHCEKFYTRQLVPYWARGMMTAR